MDRLRTDSKSVAIAGYLVANGPQKRRGFARMNKPLFTKLIKTWHPDLTTSARRKIVCEEMSRHILSANEIGDEESLKEIERVGEGYLEVVKNRELEAEEERRRDAEFGEILRRFSEMQAAESRGECAYAIPINPPRQQYLGRFLWMLNPYLLTFSVFEWRENGRLHNALATGNAAAWLWIWYHFWNQLGAIEAAEIAAGHSLAGVRGFAFVLFRGALIAAALPVALPLGVLAGGAAITISVVWVVAWIAAGVLGFFHPWLVPLPYFFAGIILSAAGWAALGEDL